MRARSVWWGRWRSVLLVAGCALVVLVCLGAVLRGRTLALVPGLLAVVLALRELRRFRRTP